MQFTATWKAHNIEGVLDLFEDDVEYWETPFRQLIGKKEIKTEWQTILTQNTINLSTTVFSKDTDRFTVQWELKYVDGRNDNKYFKSVYLITLNSQNRCTYFFHCGEMAN